MPQQMRDGQNPNNEEVLNSEENPSIETQEVVETPEEQIPAEVVPPPSPDQSYLNEMRRLYQQNQQLAEELSKVATAVNKPATKNLSPEEEAKLYYDNPVAVIRDEIGRAVQPLNDFKKMYERQNALAGVKAQMRSSGQFSHLDKIEGLFDQAMQNMDVNWQTVNAAYQMSLGAFVSQGGNLGQTQTQPQNSQPSNVGVNPPNMRPSNPAAPKRTTEKRVMTEDQRRIMRLHGFKDEAEFWKYMDADASEIFKL